jgi:NADH:ubiquinone reductase (H+-translocating)
MASTLGRVVIIGGGFGGLRAARALKRANLSITLVDRRNHHLFQPLLYQVATGDLSPANIASPLRFLLRKQKNCTTLLAEVVDFDVANKRVLLADGELPYDYLILAAGATHSYFGNDQWERYAPGLKTIEGATEIRSRILRAFEAAERETSHEARAAWLTFVIVGAGPTGTELAGALSEIANHSIRHDFRNIDPSEARIMLIEGGAHALGVYPESLSTKAAAALRDLRVDLRTSTMVTKIDEGYVILQTNGKEERIETKTVIWAAGVSASPLAKKLALATNTPMSRSGHIQVNPDLTINGHTEIMAIGDNAACMGTQGKPLPGLAPVAMQQGDFCASRIMAIASGQPFGKVFKYSDHGSMAVIGRFRAVAMIGKRQLSGLPAWFVWLAIHLMEITQFSNRILVLIQWGSSFLFRSRSARLITHTEAKAIITVPHQNVTVEVTPGAEPASR